ncbi:10253_t:CDS:2 [Ambispora gerdemannii]|uniref:Dol-P-Glc:Glc(2)Man(9)GlcNAc(2)-PP-Dol alpha-1,2-glucosyltransferase n=1 Tax=Ambispora gerdemannii TaxID=144530 RepID=A0A9N9BJX2_9GLOM|nr:10253_t:CDS:2 [Ambispora gerdemannii]
MVMVKYIFLALHATLLASIAALVNKRVSEPYMQEKAQRYCEGDYRSWDPKLTTPPGLYVISNIIIILPFLNCSTSILRAINLGFALGLYLVIWRILARLHPYQNDYVRSFNAFTLSLFPVGWFYNFLYYTDSGSTFFVLLAYLMAIEKKIKISALMATASIFFRQTNVIWLLFILGVSIVNALSDTKKNQKSDENKQLLIVKAINIDSLEQSFQQIANFIQLALQNIIFLLKSFFPFLLSLIGFTIFLKWNDGVVLGDKSNHIARMHFPQIFYFVCFTFGFGSPLVFRFSNFNLMPDFVNIRSPGYEHPFLLSDNRHYTFYVWKNIYRRHVSVKYLLIPVYVILIKILWVALANNQSFLWILIYTAGTCLSLIPSPLLEFRYFIIPFFIYRLHIRQPTTSTTITPELQHLVLEFLLYACVNIVTGILFLWRPFVWEQEEGKLQRFMW